MTNQLSFFSEKTDFIPGNPNIKASLSYFIPFCYNVWYYESKFATQWTSRAKLLSLTGREQQVTL
jgi:hypothetical protein